jgi:pimeloyl-ACP methyl ester carboxylesterase
MPPQGVLLCWPTRCPCSHGHSRLLRACGERTGRCAEVLVHGAFVDGSGWEDVYKILRRDGYSVSIVQNPTISLEDDVAVTKRTLAAQDGPTILVGHSYGGAVITEAGNHPKVAGLAYITAFAPDKGESVATLNKDSPPGASVSPILPPQDGYLFQDKAKFPASFAADVDAEKAAFWADSQVPWGVAALSGTISEPAWRTKPSWYLIAFFPVVINTVMGLAGLEREKVYLAQSMGLRPVATFFKIQLPNALPSIFAGLKISITLAVVGEFVGGEGGLGYLLLIANGNMDTALLFAGIVALTVLGVVLFGLIGLLERLVLPPHAVERASFARESM